MSDPTTEARSPASGGEPAAPGFVYLASQSPRRRALLTQIGIEARLLLPAADEDAEALETLSDGESPEAYVQRVTRAKLAAAGMRLAASGLPPAPVLCADTTVAVDAQILGKPVDAVDAARMLRLLSGRRHRVLTAVAVAANGAFDAALSISDVQVAALDAAAIAAYIATGEPFGKAGAYAIQGRFAVWVERIDGSHSGIMGLPLFETARLLQNAGVYGAASHHRSG